MGIRSIADLLCELDEAIASGQWRMTVEEVQAVATHLRVTCLRNHNFDESGVEPLRLRLSDRGTFLLGQIVGASIRFAADEGTREQSKSALALLDVAKQLALELADVGPKETQ